MFRTCIKAISQTFEQNAPHINQVHLFFRANLLDLNFTAGTESLEVELFTEAKIPWQEIAFTPVTETLKLYFHDRTHNVFPMHSAEILINKNTKTSKAIYY